MESASSNAGTPAHAKDKAAAGDPAIFEWYENRVEEGLGKLYISDQPKRQIIVGVIRDMKDSALFWKLYSSFQDSYDEAKDDDAKHDVVMAFMARVYIAGEPARISAARKRGSLMPKGYLSATGPPSQSTATESLSEEGPSGNPTVRTEHCVCGSHQGAVRPSSTGTMQPSWANGTGSLNGV